MSKRYVLVDYQNVQPARALHADSPRERLLIFLGANQSEAAARKRLGENVEYIKMSGEGHNALDFHIAFYVGELVTKEPDCDIWIVSKDKGFRHLVTHLVERKFNIRQAPDLGVVQGAPMDAMGKVRPASAIDPKRFELIAARLGSAKARPAKIRSLHNLVKSLLTKQPTRAEIRSCVDELTRRGIIAVEGQKVSYPTRK